jgi:hypothetical protein
MERAVSIYSLKAKLSSERKLNLLWICTFHKDFLSPNASMELGFLRDYEMSL